MHSPSTHVWSTSHGELHLPQCSTLSFVFVSQPLLVLPSQLPKPGRQTPMPHLPPTQVLLAFANSQMKALVVSFPQPPQLSTLRFESTSQPLVTSLSQLSRPSLHWEMPQSPAVSQRTVAPSRSHALQDVRAQPYCGDVIPTHSLGPSGSSRSMGHFFSSEPHSMPASPSMRTSESTVNEHPMPNTARNNAPDEIAIAIERDFCVPWFKTFPPIQLQLPLVPLSSKTVNFE